MRHKIRWTGVNLEEVTEFALLHNIMVSTSGSRLYAYGAFCDIVLNVGDDLVIGNSIKEENTKMEIEKMTVADIEKYLEEKKKVKPKASPDSICDLLEPWFTINDRLSIITYLWAKIDWTPPKADYELELIKGMPCLYPLSGVWKILQYSGNLEDDAIPFNRNMVGKAV